MKKYLVAFVASALMLGLSANLAFAKWTDHWSTHIDMCEEQENTICPK